MLIYKLLFHINCIIKKIFLKFIYGNKLEIGSGTHWRKRFSVMIDSNAKVEIGDNCFFNNDCSINSNGLVKIGGGTLFGENVKIYDHNHRFNNFNKTIKEQGFSVGEIIIGNHVWVGSNVVILKGAKIGNNCVIGAGCVISGTIPPNTMIKQSQNYIMEVICEAHG